MEFLSSIVRANVVDFGYVQMTSRGKRHDGSTHIRLRTGWSGIELAHGGSVSQDGTTAALLIFYDRGCEPLHGDISAGTAERQSNATGR